MGFEPDRGVGVVEKDADAGLFSFRLYIQEGKFDPSTVPEWKRQPPNRWTPYRARVAIYQCESLPPADSNGSSDPYVQIYEPGRTDIRTDVTNDTNNPIFYEVKEFLYNAPERNGKPDWPNAPPIILSIFDEDEELLDSSDDLIGRAVINVHRDLMQDEQKHISFDDEIPYPAWVSVKKNYDDKYDPDTGAAVLCSLQFGEHDKLYAKKEEEIELNKVCEISPGLKMKMPDLNITEFKCEIIVLGLRDLVSPGLLPVHKSYVKFSVKSLLPTSQAKAVDNVFTQPNDKGPNPIIRTTIQFEAELPNDPTFLPRMTCEVYDQLFLESMPQPLIGTFTIKLGDIVEDTRTQLDQSLHMFKKLSTVVGRVIRQIEDSKGSGVRPRAAEIVGTPVHSARNSQSFDAEQKLELALVEKLEA